MPAKVVPKLTAGMEALLKALEKLMDGEHEDYSVKYYEKKVKEATEALASHKRSYEYAIQNLANEEKELKKAQRKAAQIINDLGKLGCPEEVLKPAMKPLNSHDVAEWIKNE